MPGGQGVFSTSASGSFAGGGNLSSMHDAIRNQTDRQISQQMSQMNQEQLARQNQERLANLRDFEQKHPGATLGQYVDAERNRAQMAAQSEPERAAMQQRIQAAMLQDQQAERQLQQTQIAAMLSQSNPQQQERLARLFNGQFGALPQGDLPPTAMRTDLANVSRGASDLGGGILLPGTGLPPASGGIPVVGDLSRPNLEGTNIVPGSDLTSPAFSAGGLSGPPPIVTTSTSYTTVDSGASLPEIYTYTKMDAPIQADTYTTSGTDAMYRTEQTVGWSNVDDNSMSREAVSEQPNYVQPVNYTQSQIQYTNTSQNFAEQQIQYVPAEVKQEKIEVQQVQQPTKHVQEVVQEPKQPVQPTKLNVQKQVTNIVPVFSKPPAAQKPGSISSLLAGMQKGGHQPNAPNTNQNTNQNQSAGTFSRDSNADKPTEPTRHEGSLGDHLSRLQRGGGRIIPKAKDILGESDLPPQTETESDEGENKDPNS